MKVLLSGLHFVLSDDILGYTGKFRRKGVHSPSVTFRGGSNMKTKTSRILAVVLIFQLLAFSACAGWLIYDAKVDRSGWAEKDGVRFYRDFHAKPVTGWLDIDGQR